jgi:hypothetical protein
MLRCRELLPAPRFGMTVMWRELFGFVGAAVAVINGVLALAVALLPVRRSVLKLRLGVAAAVLGVVVFGGMLVARYAMHVQQERQLSDRRDARDKLEGFIADGRALLAQISDPEKPLPNRDADEWAQRTEIFLRERLGELAVMRFRKDVSELYGESGVPAARLPYWRAVRNRLVNLETMTAELPAPLRPSPTVTPKL